MKKILIITMALTTLLNSCSKNEQSNTNTQTEILYTMPDEAATHEGTWLQWPHQYEYGIAYRNNLDGTWVAMAKALALGEKVHIIAYDVTEKNRIINC